MIQYNMHTGQRTSRGTLHRGALEHSATKGTILKRGGNGARGIGEAMPRLRRKQKVLSNQPGLGPNKPPAKHWPKC